MTAPSHLFSVVFPYTESSMAHKLSSITGIPIGLIVHFILSSVFIPYSVFSVYNDCWFDLNRTVKSVLVQKHWFAHRHNVNNKKAEKNRFAQRWLRCFFFWLWVCALKIHRISILITSTLWVKFLLKCVILNLIG